MVNFQLRKVRIDLRNRLDKNPNWSTNKTMIKIKKKKISSR